MLEDLRKDLYIVTGAPKCSDIVTGAPKCSDIDIKHKRDMTITERKKESY